MDETKHIQRLTDSWPSAAIQQEAMDVRDCAAKSALRSQPNIVATSYGWPLYYFKDLRELAQGLRDAIKHHRDAYRKGVLHRRITPEQILVCPVAKGAVSKTHGRILDLRPSAIAGSFKEVCNRETRKRAENRHSITTAEFLRSELDEEAAEMVEQIRLFCTDDNPTFEKLHALAVETYIARVKRLWKLPFGRKASMSEMHWHHKDVPSKQFDFSSIVARRSTRTGTRGFVSSEVAQGGYLPASELNATRNWRLSQPFFHDAVHDLESFFWVLVFICLTRQGPGNTMRAELTEEPSTEDVKELTELVTSLFHKELVAMGAAKEKILLKGPSTLLPHLHPYFADLHGLVRRWLGLLRIAYECGQFELDNIHDCVLDLLDETLGELEKKVEPSSVEGEVEVKRRLEEWEKIASRVGLE